MATSQPLATQPQADQTPARLFRQLESYDWQTDAEFQSGLAAILGPASATQTAAQNADLTLRARCFYYARKFNEHVDHAAYVAWRAAQPECDLSPLAPANPAPPIMSSEPVTPEKGSSQAASTNGTPQKNGEDDKVIGSNASNGTREAQETQPSSFAEVMELIQSGKTIPGIKQIPGTVLEGQATEATKTQRRKPWERDQAATELAS